MKKKKRTSAKKQLENRRYSKTGDKQTISPIATASVAEDYSQSVYESLFIKPADITGRREKTVYLRGRYYARIEKILGLYNDNTKLSVFSYIDAVLEHHFKTYNKDIKEIHDKLYTSPYE